MSGASAESLAAELGLPPGTEVVRSEQTGEPLISMSAALQWMQQLVSAAQSKLLGSKSQTAVRK